MTNSFRLRREDVFLGKQLRYGESGQNTFVRLGQKNNQWVRPVHEVWDAPTETTLTHPLTHQSADSVSHFVDKLNTYTTRNAEHLYAENTKVYWWHLLAYPAGKFLQNYILKQGFRDGIHGFLHAVFMSFHSFLTRGKLWLLYHS